MTTALVHDRLRERATGIVTELAARLADPDRLIAAATAEGNLDLVPGMTAPAPPWARLGLTEGHPAAALLLTELSHRDPAFAVAAHAHLARAAAGLGGPQPTGLFGGPASLAFAARLAQRSPSHYAGLLESLDTWIEARLTALLATERERLDAARAGVRLSTFDVICGTTGLGRYLLLAPQRHRALLAETLGHLVRLTTPRMLNGRTVPGWWAPLEPGRGPQHPGGHSNLGLAHGISGPLALLSLAWRAGVRVPGQAEAIEAIAAHLLDWQQPNGLWPRSVGYDTYLAGPPGPSREGAMVAWCYGTPGTARALQLAGLALDRPHWHQRAVAAMLTALGEPARAICDTTLCHGWAGVLHIATLLARDSGDQRLAERLPGLVERVTDAYHPDRPFGFRYDRPDVADTLRQAPHRAGFLDGAAGITLALTPHTTGAADTPATAWDAALLLN
ncbi:lanthionine synthetase C family protein [Kitasatospora kifunensis]|uniref:Lanthionine synthetase n=1 Tax=Kitasatospora kifunensis TaxID=58351 RepID=A0A7W7R9R8_KITKI|nr:lanthionine synthetase C family protein [Kitasatospora kifunensis]MBB4927934.1 hypothetical protein [Kitasatospora kifunensis]